MNVRALKCRKGEICSFTCLVHLNKFNLPSSIMPLLFYIENLRQRVRQAHLYFLLYFFVLELVRFNILVVLI